jgi:hypothetical protein
MTLATESPSTTRLVVGSRYVLLTLALLFVAGAGAQFFLAGLSLFDTPSHWAEHANLGHKLGIVPWFLWIPAVLGRAGWRLILGTAMLFVLFEAQYGFIESGKPYAQALHPLNGAIMFAIALWIGLRTVALLRRPTPTRGVAEAPVAGQLERMVRT